MKDVIAITSTVYAVGTLLWACSLQFRQARAGGKVAPVPMLPFVFATALFITFAVWGFDIGLPYWAYPVIFIVTLFFTGYLMAGTCGNSLKKERINKVDRPLKPGSRSHQKRQVSGRCRDKALQDRIRLVVDSQK